MENRRIPTNRLKNFPKPDKQLFTGRVKEIEDFKSKFLNNNLMLVEGLGGIGKSGLVSKCLDELIFDDKINKENIIWFDENVSFDNFIDSSGYGETLTVQRSTDRIKYADVKGLFERDEKIVILDNFQNYDDKHFENFIAFVAEYIPEDSTIVVISRTKVTGVTIPTVLTLRGLGDDAVAYAQKLRNSNNLYKEITDNDLQIISEHLYGHPLAIQLALQLLSYGVSSENIAEKIVHFKDFETEKISKRIFRDILEHKNTKAEERDFLIDFSVFKGSVSKEALNAVFGENYLKQISVLINKRLINYTEFEYDTHPLIREFCYNDLDQKHKLDLNEKVAQHYISTRVQDIDSDLEEQILYHLSESKQFEVIANFIENKGKDFITVGLYDLLKKMLDIAINNKIEKPIFDIFHGSYYNLKSDYPKAKQYYEKASKPENEIEIQLEGLDGVAKMEDNLGNINTAKTIYEVILQKAKQNNNERFIAWGLHGLSKYYTAKGDYETAMKNAKKALEIVEELGLNNDISAAFYNIGNIYYKRQNYNEALKYTEKSLSIWKELKSKKGISACYNQIGMIYYNKNKYNSALEIYNSALEINEELSNRYGISACLNNIALVYEKQNLLDKALKNYAKSLKFCKETNDKQGYATTLSNIAIIEFTKQKKYHEALEKFFISYAIRKQIGLADAKDSISWIINLRNEVGIKEFKKIAYQIYEKLELEYKKEIVIAEFTNEPIKAQEIPGRNEIVKVKYKDGKIVKTKYKKVEADLKNGNCEFYDENEIQEELINEQNNSITETQDEPINKEDNSITEKQNIINTFINFGKEFDKNSEQNFRFLLSDFDENKNEYSLQFWQGIDYVNKTPNLLFVIKENIKCVLVISTEDDKSKSEFFEQITSTLGGYKRQRKEGKEIDKWFKVFDKKDLHENVKDFIENDKKLIDLLLSFRLTKKNLYNSGVFSGLRFITENEFTFDLLNFNVKILKNDIVDNITLKSIELENIARFESIKINLDKKLTCIIAENGVGKSTILSSIALAIAGVDANSIIKKEELELKFKIKKYDKKPIYEKSGFIKLEYSADKLYPNKPYTNKICFEHLSELQSINIYDSTEFADSFAINTGDDGNYLKQLIIGFPQGVNLFEIKDYDLKDSDKPNLNDLIPLIKGQINSKLTKDFSDWLKTVFDMEEGREQILDDIFRIMSSITETEINFRDIFYNEHSKEYTVVIDTNENPEGIPLNLISQGLSNVVIWVGNILRRMYQANYKLENIKEVKAIIIIDEIDKYLHPKWQSRILPVLLEEFENCQFIITTHSPLVLNGLGKGQIAHLKLDENGIPIVEYNDDFNVWGWEYQDILERWMLTHDSYNYNLNEEEKKLEGLKQQGKSVEEIQEQELFIEKIKESYKAKDSINRLKAEYESRIAELTQENDELFNEIIKFKK